MNWQKLLMNIGCSSVMAFVAAVQLGASLEDAGFAALSAVLANLTGLVQKPPQEIPKDSSGMPSLPPRGLPLLLLLLIARPVFAANDLTNNPWILDTAGAGTVATGNIRVTCIKWTGATTTGHTAVLTNGSDKVVWQDLAPGSNFTVSECLPLTFLGGVKLPTLGSGKVFIYVAP